MPSGTRSRSWREESSFKVSGSRQTHSRFYWGTRMSREFYYVDKNGKKQDAALHESILDNPEADLACRRQSFRSALAAGVSRAEARQLYGADADYEE